MGSAHSARRITIENVSDDGSSIKVSDSVVKRLQNGECPEDEVVDDKAKLQQVRHSDLVKNNKSQLSASQYPYFTHNVITTHQIRQEIERELEENNDYWEKRMAMLQQEQDKMVKVLEEEYKTSSEEIEKYLPRMPPKDGKLPCITRKKKVVECYKRNTKKPLMCSKEVSAFADCMCNIRVKLQEHDKLS